MPFAVVAIMGISGAFLTTSMQSVSKAAAPKLGYIDGPQGPCSVALNCNTIPNPLCQANGVQAFGKANNCTEVLFMPPN
ncbi:hypothetical protein D3C85_1701970 [compost metagenome]